jgi:hypothetical protein
MTARFYQDRHILCREIAVKGKAPTVEMFLDRRAGMTFPTANNPGYYCVFGLRQVISHKDKRPMELLAEYETHNQTALFLSLVKTMRLLQCSVVYADCSKAFESAEMELEQVLTRLNVSTIGLYDASEFDGFESQYASFEAARAPLDAYGRKGLLKIPGAFREWGNPDKGRVPGFSLITRDLQSAGKDTVKAARPWESYPAANAFNHVIMSYVISPYQEPEKDYSTTKNEGYGG